MTNDVCKCNSGDPENWYRPQNYEPDPKVSGESAVVTDVEYEVRKLVRQNMKFRGIILQIERVISGMDSATTDPEIIRAQLDELKEMIGAVIHDSTDANP